MRVNGRGYQQQDHEVVWHSCLARTRSAVSELAALGARVLAVGVIDAEEATNVRRRGRHCAEEAIGVRFDAMMLRCTRYEVMHVLDATHRPLLQ